MGSSERQVFRTGNPVLKDDTFRPEDDPGAKMTLGGTVGWCFFLLGLVATTFTYSWNEFDAVRKANASAVTSAPPASSNDQPKDKSLVQRIKNVKIPPQLVAPFLVAFGVSFVVGLVTCFRPREAWALAPIYALGEGYLLGIISCGMDVNYPGIAAQAGTLTLGVFFTLLVAYLLRLAQPSENFKLGVISATGGLVFAYFGALILRSYGIDVPVLNDATWLGICVSIGVVILAALNLVLDFDFIETGVERGAPKYMEAYGAFGLIVTLVWLYLEILRLLAKVYGNRSSSSSRS